MNIFEGNDMLPVLKFDGCFRHHFPRSRRHQNHLKLTDGRIDEPFALTLLRQFFVLAIEPIILVAHLFGVRYQAIDFTLLVVRDECRRATQRNLSNRPLSVIGQVRWENGNLQFVLLIEIDQTVRTIDIVEGGKASHYCQAKETVRTQFASGA